MSKSTFLQHIKQVNQKKRNQKVKQQAQQEYKRQTKTKQNRDNFQSIRKNQEDSAQSYLVQEDGRTSDQKLLGLKRNNDSFNLLNYQKNVANPTLNNQWRRQVFLINQFLEEHFLEIVQYSAKEDYQREKIHKKQVFSIYCRWRKRHINEGIASTEGVQSKSIQMHLTNELKKVLPNCRVERSYFVGIKYKNQKLVLLQHKDPTNKVQNQ